MVSDECGIVFNAAGCEGDARIHRRLIPLGFASRRVCNLLFPPPLRSFIGKHAIGLRGETASVADVIGAAHAYPVRLDDAV